MTQCARHPASALFTKQTTVGQYGALTTIGGNLSGNTSWRINMITIKVEGGTARNDENLCDNCQNATIATDSKDQSYVQCAVFSQMINTRIVKCTAWKHTNHQSLWDMREQAWIIGRSTGKAGFRGAGDLKLTHYKKLSQEEKKDVDDDAMDF